MFIQSAFIRKNTPELRKKLEDIGYINGAWESPHFKYPYLECTPNRTFGMFKGEGHYFTQNDYKCAGSIYKYNPPKHYIDCGINEELFIAIASLRDDTNKNQWFTDGEIWEINSGEFDLMNPITGVMYHKATVEELIEHFKE